MQLNRRQICGLGASAALLVAMGSGLTPAIAAETDSDEIIKAFTGGADIATGRVSLSAPEIAENGNTVPISFSVESDMTPQSHVSEVIILATGNPRPGVATFKFSPLNGEAGASTRIRLAKTQDIVAVAKMSDGAFFMDKKTVKVTIGGCGG